LLAALAGGGLVAAGASAWNQCCERVVDGRMDRTRGRPLPQGRLSLWEAGALGTLALAAGLAVLWTWATPAAAAVGAATWALYVCAYTPLKLVTPLNTLVGAVAGALPPVLGWAAITGGVAPGAWALFAVVFLWQIPHVLALGAMYADDYRRAGVRLLSLEPSTGAAARQSVAAALALVVVGCWPAVLGVAGPLSAAAAVTLGLWYARAAMRWAFAADGASARQLFRTSLAYLPLLFSVLVVERCW
jgi:protoheme IX farnesyltransferase